jgi:hypothetical protein
MRRVREFELGVWPYVAATCALWASQVAWAARQARTSAPFFTQASPAIAQAFEPSIALGAPPVAQPEIVRRQDATVSAWTLRI